MLVRNILSLGILAALPLSGQVDAAVKPFAYETKVNHVIAKDAAEATDRYFIQLRDLPTALIASDYSNKKTKYNAQLAAVKAQKVSLENKQSNFDTVLKTKLGRMPKVHYRYQTALNGLSVDLTEAEAELLLELPEVLKVIRQVNYQLNTDVSPEQLGVDKVWQGVDGTTMPAKGEGIIMGIIDSGINADHPSFAAQGDDGYVHTNPKAGYLGDCVADASLCNDKLIGVFHYDSVTATYDGVRPENGVDYNGHGSHVASTAAGNILTDLPYYQVGNEAVSSGTPIEGTYIERMAGMAPHANIISFQVCLPVSGCAQDAMVMAIEDAIENGVDVLNMSIGPNGEGPHAWNSALDMAFLAAHEAGVFVALSAGNSGSGASTVGHLAPWTTIVANATHGRYFEKNLTVNSTQENALADIVGRGNISEALTGEIVYSGDLYPSHTQCNFYPFREYPELEGKVVLCDRGSYSLMNMAMNVQTHGGKGIVIRNTDNSAEQLHSIPFAIPGIMVNQTDGNALKAWMETEENPSVNLSVATKRVDESQANIINISSSRGPNSQYPDLVVPHIAAPGTDVYAAYTDEQPFHHNPAPGNYSFLTGTSMASPHIAGIAALIKQLHPSWSPSEIQSAMMLTANGKMLKEDGETAADIWDMGSGMVRADHAVKSGLIMHVNKDEFMAADPAQSGDVTSLNMAYLANANCAGTCTWTRSFTATEDADWNFSLANRNYSFASFTATPSDVSVKAGETFEVTFEASIAPGAGDEWIESSIAITSSSQQLSMPVKVRPLVAVVPQKIDTDYYFLTGDFPLAGFKFRRPDGVFFTNNALVKADSYELTLTNDSDNTVSPFENLEEGVGYFLLDLEANNIPIDIYIAQASNQDTDLFVGFDSNGDGIPQDLERLCVSATPNNEGEHCQIPGTLSGTYWVMAWNYQNDNAETADITIDVVQAEADKKVAMSITKGLMSNAYDEIDLSVAWDGDLEPNASYYSNITTYMRNELTGDYGHFADTIFKVAQLGAPASVQLNDSTVSVGKQTELQFEFAPNLLEHDVNYTVTLSLADGFMLADNTLGEFNAKQGVINYELTVAANTQESTQLVVPIKLVDTISGEFEHLVEISTDYEAWQQEFEFTQINDNTPPEVDITVSQQSGDAGQQVTFTARASDDGEAELSYVWRQISGVSAMTGVQTGSSMTVTMPKVEQDASLVFEVVVSDGEFSTSATKTVAVNKEEVVIVEDDDEQSGSLYYLLLLALPAIFRRRK